ncbi:uncharacterized protein LOC130357512 [Hyla sarda]|uniref:uncharacterized protein LOC130357512 n=1 Tax=Hyla sarda TaxID=327740 RepID=UPI0024C3E91C|nr:uncharacterized protein LOC130357512 [Hyla sarda]
MCSSNITSHDTAVGTLFKNISKVTQAALVFHEVFIQMLQLLEEHHHDLQHHEQEWRKMKKLLQSEAEFLDPCVQSKRKSPVVKRILQKISIYFDNLRSALINKIPAGKYLPYIMCSSNITSHDTAVGTLFKNISKVSQAALVFHEVFIQMLQLLEEHHHDLQHHEQEWRKMKKLLQSEAEFLDPCVQSKRKSPVVKQILQKIKIYLDNLRFPPIKEAGAGQFLVDLLIQDDSSNDKTLSAAVMSDLVMSAPLYVLGGYPLDLEVEESGIIAN